MKLIQKVVGSYLTVGLCAAVLLVTSPGSPVRLDILSSDVTFTEPASNDAGVAIDPEVASTVYNGDPDESIGPTIPPNPWEDGSCPSGKSGCRA